MWKGKIKQAFFSFFLLTTKKNEETLKIKNGLNEE